MTRGGTVSYRVIWALWTGHLEVSWVEPLTVTFWGWGIDTPSSPLSCVANFLAYTSLSSISTLSTPFQASPN
jgi:hypothetical protein